MSDALMLFLAWAAGGLLGAAFFGGLWWTIQRGLSSSRPALWFVGSLLVRTGIVLAGFCLVGRGDWERLVLCLVGFVMARLVVTWVTRPPRILQASSAKEVSHAPDPR